MKLSLLILRSRLQSSASPAALFVNGEVGVWFDPSDLTTLFQDSAGVTPVTAPNQPVGLMLDKSGRGNHATQATAASRPTYGIHPITGVRNLLLATDTMSTQSRTVTAAPHTLSFLGTGTVVLTGASIAGPLIGTGAGNRVSLTFTPTAAPLVMTVVGSVILAQLELGSTVTAYQRVVSQFEVTETGVPSVSYLGFDGVDDFMSTGNINFSATDAMTVFAGIRKRSDAARAFVFNNETSGTRRISLEAPNSSLNNYAIGSGGTVITSVVTVVAAPNTSVLSATTKTSADIVKLRRNGVVIGSSSADQGTGNYSNAPLFIGRFAGTLFPFNGNLYSLIIRGTESTEGQITSTESWVNGKTGAY